MSVYLCWRCMRRFEAAAKSKGKIPCPNGKCNRGGGITTKIAEKA